MSVTHGQCDAGPWGRNRSITGAQGIIQVHDAGGTLSDAVSSAEQVSTPRPSAILSQCSTMFVTQHFHRIFVVVYCKGPLKNYSNQRINRLTEYLPSDPFKSSFQLEGKCTLCRCKSGRITPLSAWINIGNGKGSSSWVRQQCENRQASLPCARDLLNPKINRQTVED